MQARFFHKPLFWVLATALSAGLCYTAFKLFPIAFPIVSVDLTMDRAGALRSASELAKQHSIGPESYSTAVAFAGDNKAKIYIQLDGGGVDRFKEVIKQEYFAPYYWKVRHFNAQQKHEATFYFMPDGRPYGFKEKIADSTLLPTLTKPQAEELAQENGALLWNIHFAQHTLVEHSTNEKPNGRVDHTLVYELNDEKIDQAPFNVTIKVSGNKVTRTLVSLKIPEAFERRYTNMRSANDMIAGYATSAMFIIYILLGCLLGLFLLIRSNRDWLLWRAPVVCAAFISLGMVLDKLNSYSQWWLGYQTTDTSFSFIARNVQNMFINAATNFMLLYITFIAAESLTRKAFPKQIQLWPSYKTDVASSWQLLGRTIGGYLMIGFDFIFVTMFYLISIKYLGWWSPSDTLIDPNILAKYAPWFSPFIKALHAGFWEECLFRAVPLASAMILARRYGKMYWWMGSAMIIQALIFAGAHANYPAQPAYARLVELILPSFVFGGLYLAFGLIPAIISHVTYDLILMALPILISDAHGSIFNKIMVVLCGLIPLLVVLYARYIKGRFHTLSERWYNYNWLPASTTSQVRDDTHHVEPTQPMNYRALLILIGLVSVVGWGMLRKKHQDIAPLVINREQALEHARTAQQLFNLTIPQTYTTLSTTRSAQDRNGTFVWRVAGKEIYSLLSGTFINPALWKIRSAQFDGDIIESAEEYAVYIGSDGTPFEFEHHLPKEQYGVSLAEDEARAMTLQLLQSYYKLVPEDVTEISAQETKEPHRRDWEFVYKLNKAPDLKDGQLRIRVKIGGNKIVSHDRFVHIPEEWERNYAYETSIKNFIQLSALLLLLGLMALLGLFIIRRRPIHPFAIKSALTVLVILLLKSCIQTYNLWPIMIAHFQTSVPYTRQVSMLLIHLLLTTVVISLFFAWLSGYVIGLLQGRCTKKPIDTLLQGLAIGFCVAGMSALTTWLLPATKPFILDTSNVDAFVPALSMALKNVMPIISYTLIGWFITHGLNVLSDYGSEKKGAVVTTLIILGFALSGFEPSISLLTLLSSGVITGIVLTAFYYLAIRYNYCLIPVIVATHVSIQVVQEVLLFAFPGVNVGAVLSMLVIWSLTLWLMNQLNKRTA